MFNAINPVYCKQPAEFLIMAIYYLYQEGHSKKYSNSRSIYSSAVNYF